MFIYHENNRSNEDFTKVNLRGNPKRKIAYDLTQLEVNLIDTGKPPKDNNRPNITDRNDHVDEGRFFSASVYFRM